MHCKICGNPVHPDSVDDLCIDCEIKYNQEYEDAETEQKIYNGRRRDGEPHGH